MGGDPVDIGVKWFMVHNKQRDCGKAKNSRKEHSD